MKTPLLTANKGMARLRTALMLITLGAGCASAQEFRTFNPISSPGRIPEGATLMAQERPVDRNTVNDSAQTILKSWNTGELEKYLGQEFQNRSRLADAMAEKVPKDATVRLLSIRGVQTLAQFERQVPETGRREIVSTVSVTAATQIEFNDARQGFRRLQGTNEYILKITEEVGK